MTSNLLRDDHAQVGALVKELDAALGREDAARSFALLDLVWARLAVHIRAEHLCLFPAILDALAELPEAQSEAVVTSFEAKDLIAHLREDHNFFMNELASAIKVMREMGSAPSDERVARALRSVRRKVNAVGHRLEQHNRLEEERLYRWPASLLTTTEQARLLARVAREVENLPPRLPGSIKSA
jgi:hypothetical protein